MLDLEFPETESIGEDMPSLNHSYLCTQIMRQLLQNPDILPLPELSLDIENGLTPDISVYWAKEVQPDFFHDITRYSHLPILAIEIISSSQNIQDLLSKAVKLIEAGVKNVWTLEPYSRTVFLTNATVRNQRFHEQLVETDGIAVDFKKLFESRT